MAAAGVSTVTPPGQDAYTTPGTYSWICPPGVTSVSVVCVGAGGSGYAGGGGGGGLGWKNNISVTPGESYTVVVGNYVFAGGENSYFISDTTVKGGGASLGYGGNFVGDGGGNGGQAYFYSSGTTAGGAGAAGYTGNGGNGNFPGVAATSGSGGGGGGGTAAGVSGGGVGLLGQGADGPAGGYGGSGGTNGSGYVAGIYGGGGANPYANIGTGGKGAVRIIWPGTTRQFPSTNTGNV